MQNCHHCMKFIEIYRLSRKTQLILNDYVHPANKYFDILPSGQRYRYFKGNKRFLDSTIPQAVRLLNSRLYIFSYTFLMILRAFICTELIFTYIFISQFFFIQYYISKCTLIGRLLLGFLFQT